MLIHEYISYDYDTSLTLVQVYIYKSIKIINNNKIH